MFRIALIALLASALRGQISQSPQDLLKEAVTFQQAGKLDSAIDKYRLFLDMYPDVVQARSNLGAALAGAGRYSEAITEYRRALLLQPNPQVRLNLALAYYKTSNLPQAVETLLKVRQELPQDLRPALVLADCYLRLGKNKDVIELLNPLQQANPADAGLIYMLGTALVRDGQTARGQAIINVILKNEDSAESRLLMGTTKMMVNDYNGAMVDLKKAVDLNPDLPDAFSYYGDALLATGDPAAARKAFERALTADPNNFDANLRMGVLLRQDEDNEAAMKFFAHALEVRPGDLGVRYQIASAELAVGRVEQGRGHLESIVKEAPNFTEAHVSLATAYYREKRKADGDRERALVTQLNAAKQATEPGVKAAQ